jgi:acetyl-CoA synthetase
MSDTFQRARDFLLEHREDYETAYAGFRWPNLKHFNWALDWFDSIARGERRDRIALCIAYEDGTDDRLTFSQLSDRSSQIANYLRHLGVRRGDRVMVMLGNIQPLWETMLAIMKIGAVFIPTATQLKPHELGERILRGGVQHIVAAADCAGNFEGIAADCTCIAVGGPARGWHEYENGYDAPADFRPDGETMASDPLQLYFTSGTTSKPKLVLHTHVSYPVGHLSTMYWIGLQPGDIHCNISSPGWAKHAWSCVFAPWNAEATVLVVNQSRFNAPRLLDTLVRYEATTFCAPPTVWRMLVLEHLANHKVNLREVVSAGEPLNPEIIGQVRDVWDLTIREGYGQTETSAIIGNAKGQLVKPGSMGKPLPGFRVFLTDANNKEADEGELCLSLEPKPVGLMSGYQNKDGTTLAVEGSVYRTGDVMLRDNDGYLIFVGRSDDVFKASDYRISPFELESALIEHPDIIECAVVPSPDPIRLAVPKAFIVLRPGIEPSGRTALSIFQHIRRVLAPYKRVRRLEFADLPKTVSGKIRRVELRCSEAANVERGTRPKFEFREEDFPELEK